MIARCAAVSLLVVAVFAPGCGARATAWNTALDDTGCHAANVIVRKDKSDAARFNVLACGEQLVYRCDAPDTCVAVGPSGAPMSTPDGADPTSEPMPVDEALDEDPPADEPTDEPPVEEASDAEDAEADEADAPGDDADADADDDAGI